MPYVIHFAGNKNIFRDIVADEFEIRVAREVLDIGDIPSDEIVDGYDAMSLFKQAITEVGAEKARPTGDDACWFKGCIGHR
jgi:hypothetical protein